MNLSIPYGYWYLAIRHQKVIPTQILQEIRKRLQVPWFRYQGDGEQNWTNKIWWQMNTHRITKIVLWKLSLKIKTACACFLRGPLFVWLVCREIVHSKSWRTSWRHIEPPFFGLQGSGRFGLQSEDFLWQLFWRGGERWGQDGWWV